MAAAAVLVLERALKRGARLLELCLDSRRTLKRARRLSVYCSVVEPLAEPPPNGGAGSCQLWGQLYFPVGKVNFEVWAALLGLGYDETRAPCARAARFSLFRNRWPRPCGEGGTCLGARSGHAEK